MIYCIGLTADYREHPLDAIEAHVCRLVEFLRRAQFDSLLYLSSTRLYSNARGGSEAEHLVIDPLDPEDILNASKLAGECACLAMRNPRIRIVRLSNVLGQDFQSQNFVFSVLRDAVDAGSVVLRTTPDSAKDYILIDDVVALLPRIARTGRESLYNVASGSNLTHEVLLGEIMRLTGCSVTYSPDAKRVIFPPISIGRIAGEFGFAPLPVLPTLAGLVETYRKARASRR